MNRYAYILVFDRDDLCDYKTIHDKIISIDSLISWFHYIKSSYILITKDPTANQLAKKVQPIIPKKYFLLMAIDLKNRQGWLPPKAWEWIYKQVDKLQNDNED